VASDIECQTDAFLDKPATPLFIPAKSGKDVETQIEEGEVGNSEKSWKFGKHITLNCSRFGNCLNKNEHVSIIWCFIFTITP